MQYFLLFPDDTEEDVANDDNHLLGDASFGNFWPGAALGALMTVVDNEPERLPTLRIIAENGQKFTIEEFISVLEPLNIKKH